MRGSGSHHIIRGTSQIKHREYQRPRQRGTVHVDPILKRRMRKAADRLFGAVAGEHAVVALHVYDLRLHLVERRSYGDTNVSYMDIPTRNISTNEEEKEQRVRVSMERASGWLVGRSPSLLLLLQRSNMNRSRTELQRRALERDDRTGELVCVHRRHLRLRSTHPSAHDNENSHSEYTTHPRTCT